MSTSEREGGVHHRGPFDRLRTGTESTEGERFFGDGELGGFTTEGPSTLRQAQGSQAQDGHREHRGGEVFWGWGSWEGEVGVMGRGGWDGSRGLSESGFAGLEDGAGG